MHVVSKGGTGHKDGKTGAGTKDWGGERARTRQKVIEARGKTGKSLMAGIDSVDERV